LRLRASEIALGLQLKKEKEKSQRIIVDAESAVSSRFILSLYRTSAEKHGPVLFRLAHILFGCGTCYPVSDAGHVALSLDNVCSAYFSPVDMCAILGVIWPKRVAVNLYSIGAIHISWWLIYNGSKVPIFHAPV
jgi:hypothetical protein